jgi:hypothetical protein
MILAELAAVECKSRTTPVSDFLSSQRDFALLLEDDSNRTHIIAVLSLVLDVRITTHRLKVNVFCISLMALEWLRLQVDQSMPSSFPPCISQELVRALLRLQNGRNLLLAFVANNPFLFSKVSKAGTEKCLQSKICFFFFYLAN